LSARREPEVSSVSSRVPTLMKKPIKICKRLVWRNALLLLIILKQCTALCGYQRTAKALTHVYSTREGLSLGQHGESVVEAGYVVFSLHLVGEKRFVALKGDSGIEFVHGESCSA